MGERSGLTDLAAIIQTKRAELDVTYSDRIVQLLRKLYYPGVTMGEVTGQVTNYHHAPCIVHLTVQPPVAVRAKLQEHLLGREQKGNGLSCLAMTIEEELRGPKVIADIGNFVATREQTFQEMTREVECALDSTHYWVGRVDTRQDALILLALLGQRIESKLGYYGFQLSEKKMGETSGYAIVIQKRREKTVPSKQLLAVSTREDLVRVLNNMYYSREGRIELSIINQATYSALMDICANHYTVIDIDGPTLNNRMFPKKVTAIRLGKIRRGISFSLQHAP